MNIWVLLLVSGSDPPVTERYLLAALRRLVDMAQNRDGRILFACGR